MLNKNEIKIDGDGNITLQNIQGSTISISKGDDATAIMHKLQQLHDAQLDALQQISDKQTTQFSDLLKGLLKGIVSQKNIVSNATLIIKGDSHIGDKITYQIHLPTHTIPQELTINLPKVEDLTKIIGRKDDLDEVRELLETKQKVVVVNGLGGIGKTTLAQAYLTQYCHEYAHILWVSQSEGDNFTLDLLTAQGLTLNLGIKTSGKDTQMIFTEIIAKLKSITDKPNLFIIDNANATLQTYFDYLPKPPNWHILATAREKIEHFSPKDLGFLTEDNAVLLFKQHCKRITDETLIKSVLKTIDYHTLTIEILAKTAQRYDTPLEVLKHAIERDLKAEVYIQHKGSKIAKVTSYLLSIFDLTPLSNEEQRLLQHFAALPTEFIDYDLLKYLIPNSEDGIAATLQDLNDKGWLLYNSEPESYKIHLVIQEVVKRKLPPSVTDLQGLIDNVTSLLSIDQTKDNPVDKFPFIPFGEAVLAVFYDSNNSVNLLRNNLATVFQENGKYNIAKELLEQVVYNDEINWGTNHTVTSVHYSNLALVLKDIGEYKRAKELLEKAIDIDESNFGKNDQNTTRSYSNLALVLQAMGYYQDAKELLIQVINSDENNFGDTHQHTAGSYSLFASVLQDMGDYNLAKVFLEKAIHLSKQNFEESHPNITAMYNNLATLLQEMGEYEDAKKIFEKIIIFDKQTFGEMHPTTQVNYINLATLLKDIGDYESAKMLLEKTMSYVEKNLGEKHPITIQTYSSLALVLKALGNCVGAKTLLEKAVVLAEQNFGEKHPTTAASYNNLATVLQDISDYVNVKILLQKAIIANELSFGENSPNTAVSYSNLALVLKDLKEYEKAILLAVKAYRIYVEQVGQQHPNTKIIGGVGCRIVEEMLENGWTMEQIQKIIND